MLVKKHTIYTQPILTVTQSNMTTLIALSAIGLAAYHFWPSSGVKASEAQLKNQIELREASHTGFLRATNSSRTNNLASEETRVIRNPKFGANVLDNVRSAWTYYKEKNDLIANMTNGANVLINQATIRPNMQKKPGLLQLPSREGWAEDFGDISNVTFDIDLGVPSDLMTVNWRDEYGDAGGFPREGRHNVVLNELYVGNPWGPGGQLFEAVGNQHRDPGYADYKPTGILKKPRSDAHTRLQNKVKFKQ